MATRDTRPMGSIRKDFGLDGDSRIRQPGVGVIVENELDESGLTGVNKGVGTVPLSPITGPTAKGIQSLTDDDLGQTRRPFDSTMTGIPRQDLPFTGTIQGLPARAINQFPLPIVGLPINDGDDDPFNKTSLGRITEETIPRQIGAEPERLQPTESEVVPTSLPEPIIELTVRKALEVVSETNVGAEYSNIQAAMLKISELEQDLAVIQKSYNELLTTTNEKFRKEEENSLSLSIALGNMQELFSEKELELEKVKANLNSEISRLTTELERAQEELKTSKSISVSKTQQPLQQGPNDLVRVSKLPTVLQWAINLYFYFFKK